MSSISTHFPPREGGTGHLLNVPHVPHDDLPINGCGLYCHNVRGGFDFLQRLPQPRVIGLEFRDPLVALAHLTGTTERTMWTLVAQRTSKSEIHWILVHLTPSPSRRRSYRVRLSVRLRSTSIRRTRSPASYGTSATVPIAARGRYRRRTPRRLRRSCARANAGRFHSVLFVVVSWCPPTSRNPVHLVLVPGLAACPSSLAASVSSPRMLP